MKQEYRMPDMEVIRFENKEVITTSNETEIVPHNEVPGNDVLGI